MVLSVQHYFQEGLAPSTRKAYNSAMKRFWGFCGQYSVTDPFPVTEHLLCAFAAHSADSGLAGQTYLAAVRNTQLSLGLPDRREQSSLPILKRVQAGIARVRLGRGQPSRIRLPITAQILHQIKQELSRTAHPERLVLWAVCCTAFFGFCRLGELLLSSQSAFTPRRHLAWGDMAVDNQQTASMVRYHLKQSKTDQAGQGVDIILGRTGLDLCPVTAVLSYVAARGRAGPFFLTTAGVSLTKQAFISELRKLLRTIGLPDESYAGHSFRIGAATSAGIKDSTIQLLGRSQSSAFLRYIRTPQDQLVAISVSLASQFHQGASPGRPTMGH